MGRDTSELIIWAAGFFDGEGCVCIARSKKNGSPIYNSYTLQISAFQNARTPLDVLQTLFGGSVGKNQNGWHWARAGASAKPVLEQLLPYLIVKRTQAELGIAFQSRKTTQGGKYPDPAMAKHRDRLDWEEMLRLKQASRLS